MNLRDRLLLQPWAINFEYALTYGSAAVAVLQGKDPFPEISKSKWRKQNKTNLILMDDDLGGNDQDDNDDMIDTGDAGDVDPEEEQTVAEGSVAHMKLRGPVIKYNQFCGPRGTVDYAQELNSLTNDTNVIGGVFEIESGGGEYYAIKPLADAIKNFAAKKPLIVLSGDFLCSAAYYLAIYGTEVWFQHPKSIIGSIGTMISFPDMRPYFEKMGVVFHDIYADDAVLKNKTTKEALKGNYVPIKAKMLNPINDDFKADVVSLRGRKLSSNKAILQGETFFGTEALSLGMIDQEGDLKAAVARVRQLAAKPKPISTQQNTDMKYPKLTALLTALEGGTAATQEQLTAVNEEFTAGGIKGIGLFLESTVAEGTTAKAELVTTKASLDEATGKATTLTEQLGTANTSITTLTAENTTLKGKVASAPAAAAPITGKEDPKTEKTQEQVSQETINALPHNQGILTNPLFQKN